MKNQALVLERETFVAKNGKEMYNYFVRGVVHGREVKADFLAKDLGGYELLDLMFEINPKVNLIMHEETMTDEKGNASKYMVYEAQVVDADGLVYTYKLKLAQESDKSYLNILMQLQGAYIAIRGRQVCVER